MDLTQDDTKREDNSSSNTEESAEAQEAEKKEIEVLQTKIEEKDRQIEDYVSMLQRLQAEFENYKKRAERERAEYTEQANADLIFELLTIMDDFERALNAEGATTDFDSFKKGVSMIFSQLEATLEKEGLSHVKALGEEFDPYFHEAVLTAVGDYDDDTVIEELEKGYLFRNRVLRPSKVKVGKKGD
jgi:molecular chaperone GrpE